MEDAYTCAEESLWPRNFHSWMWNTGYCVEACRTVFNRNSPGDLCLCLCSPPSGLKAREFHAPWSHLSRTTHSKGDFLIGCLGKSEDPNERSV